jgi:hypothetical protein
MAHVEMQGLEDCGCSQVYVVANRDCCGAHEEVGAHMRMYCTLVAHREMRWVTGEYGSLNMNMMAHRGM